MKTTKLFYPISVARHAFSAPANPQSVCIRTNYLILTEAIVNNVFATKQFERKNVVSMTKIVK